MPELEVRDDGSRSPQAQRPGASPPAGFIRAQAGGASRSSRSAKCATHPEPKIAFGLAGNLPVAGGLGLAGQDITRKKIAASFLLKLMTKTVSIIPLYSCTKTSTPYNKIASQIPLQKHTHQLMPGMTIQHVSNNILSDNSNLLSTRLEIFNATENELASTFSNSQQSVATSRQPMP
jgi:hypothetical protein